MHFGMRTKISLGILLLELSVGLLLVPLNWEQDLGVRKCTFTHCVYCFNNTPSTMYYPGSFRSKTLINYIAHSQECLHYQCQELLPLIDEKSFAEGSQKLPSASFKLETSQEATDFLKALKLQV